MGKKQLGRPPPSRSGMTGLRQFPTFNCSRRMSALVKTGQADWALTLEHSANREGIEGRISLLAADQRPGALHYRGKMVAGPPSDPCEIRITLKLHMLFRSWVASEELAKQRRKETVLPIKNVPGIAQKNLAAVARNVACSRAKVPCSALDRLGRSPRRAGAAATPCRRRACYARTRL